MVIVLVLLPVLVAACGDDSDSAGTDTSSTSSTTKAPARRDVDGTLALGQLAPITGSLAPIAKSMTAPVQVGGRRDQPLRWRGRQAGDDRGRRRRGRRQPGAREHVVQRPRRHQEGGRADRAAATGTALDLLSSIRTNRVLTCSGSNSAEELSVRGLRRLLLPHRCRRTALQAIALGRLLAAEGKHQAGDRRPQGRLRRSLRRSRWHASCAGPGSTPPGKPIRYNPDDEEPHVRSARRSPTATRTRSSRSRCPTRTARRSIQSLSAAGVGPEPAPGLRAGRHAEHDVPHRGRPGQPRGRVRDPSAPRLPPRRRDRRTRSPPRCARPASRRSSPRTTTTARSSPRSPRSRPTPTTRRR